MKLTFDIIGKRRIGKVYRVFIGAAINIIIEFCKKKGFEEGEIIDAIDETVRNLFPGGVINQYIILDERFLNRRVERELNYAIDEYKRLTGEDEGVKIEPVYSEKESDGSVAQDLLGGEMRLQSPWTDNNNGI